MSVADYESSQIPTIPTDDISDLLYCHHDDQLVKLEILIRMCLGQINQDVGIHRPPIQIFLIVMNVIVGYRDTPEIQNMVNYHVPHYVRPDSHNVGTCVAWAYQIIGYNEYEVFDDDEDEDDWGGGDIGQPDLNEITQRLRKLLNGNDFANNPAIFQALVILILNVLVAGAKPDFKGLKSRAATDEVQDIRHEADSEQHIQPTRRNQRPV